MKDGIRPLPQIQEELRSCLEEYRDVSRIAYCLAQEIRELRSDNTLSSSPVPESPKDTFASHVVRQATLHTLCKMYSIALDNKIRLSRTCEALKAEKVKTELILLRLMKKADLLKFTCDNLDDQIGQIVTLSTRLRRMQERLRKFRRIQCEINDSIDYLRR